MSAAPPDGRRGGGARRALVRVAGSALFLALLLAFVPLAELGAGLRRVPASTWVAALAAYLALHLALGVPKWRMLLRAAGVELPFAQAARCYLFGLFGNTFLPSAVGGDLLRAGLAIRLGGRTAPVVLAGAVDRLLDVLALAAAAALGALAVPAALGGVGRGALATLLVGILAAGALGAGLAVAAGRGRLPQVVARRLEDARGALGSLAARPAVLLASLARAFTLQLALVGLNRVLASGVGVDLGYGVWLFVWSLAKAASMLPVTLGGIGVRETAQVALLAPFGVPAAAAAAAGVAFQATVQVGNLLAGAGAWLLGHRRMGAAAPSSLARPH